MPSGAPLSQGLVATGRPRCPGTWRPARNCQDHGRRGRTGGGASCGSLGVGGRWVDRLDGVGSSRGRGRPPAGHLPSPAAPMATLQTRLHSLSVAVHLTPTATTCGSCPSPQIPVPALPVGGSQGREHLEERGSKTLPKAWPWEGHRAGESRGQPQPEWAGGAELSLTGSGQECCPGRLLLGRAEGVAPNVPEWSPGQGTRLLVEEGAGRAVSPLLDATPAGLSEPLPVLLEMSTEIRGCLTELESCFRLLLPFDLDLGPGAARCPVPEEGHRGEEQPCCSKSLPACARRPGAMGTGGPPPEDEDGDLDAFVRQHGLGSRQYTLALDLTSGRAARTLGHWGHGPRVLGVLGPLGL